MSDFIGFDQAAAVLARLRSELTKPVLTGAAPRTFDADFTPTGGGYGLTFTGDPAAHMPYAWTNGDHDELCPVLEAGRFVDFERAEAIQDATAISPFTDAELRDYLDDATDSLRNGAGFMVLNGADIPNASVLSSGQGTRGQLSMASVVSIDIVVPAGRGRGQLDIYAGVLAAVLTDAVIKINANAYLQFVDAPPQAIGLDFERSTRQWLVAIWEGVANRNYRAPSARGTP